MTGFIDCMACGKKYGGTHIWKGGTQRLRFNGRMVSYHCDCHKGMDEIFEPDLAEEELIDSPELDAFLRSFIR
jgi:hypothetical protein